MAPSLPRHHHPLIFLSLLLLVPLAVASRGPQGPPTYHGGLLLTENINIALLWYGPFGRVQKRVIGSFINSLNYNAGATLKPQVSSWWRVVESYQAFARLAGPPGLAPPINITVVRQVMDLNYSVGNVLTVDFIRPLAQQAAAGTHSSSYSPVEVLRSRDSAWASALCTVFPGHSPTLLSGTRRLSARDHARGRSTPPTMGLEVPSCGRQVGTSALMLWLSP